MKNVETHLCVSPQDGFLLTITLPFGSEYRLAVRRKDADSAPRSLLYPFLIFAGAGVHPDFLALFDKQRHANHGP
jgi:hypothetical protein